MPQRLEPFISDLQAQPLNSNDRPDRVRVVEWGHFRGLTQPSRLIDLKLRIRESNGVLISIDLKAHLAVDDAKVGLADGSSNLNGS